MKKIIFTYMFLLLSVVGLFAQTAEEEIRTLLETRDAEIKELVGPKGTELDSLQKEQLKEIVNGTMDLESMASYALGNTYNEITEEQREEFVSLFRSRVRNHSVTQLDTYRADIIYEGITVDGDKATVNTIASKENARIPVTYELRNNGTEWLITDLIIDQVSTAESYYTSFQGVIRQHGFDGLLERLRPQVDDA